MAIDIVPITMRANVNNIGQIFNSRFAKTAAILFFAGFLFFGLSSKALAATTHYIRTDGNNTNCTGLVDAAYPGSGSAQPCAWTTLDYTLTGSHISYGDTVIIDAGTYTPTAEFKNKQ
jgi:hypothetical protein